MKGEMALKKRAAEKNNKKLLQQIWRWIFSLSSSRTMSVAKAGSTMRDSSR
jgi:hypothetical protein